MRKLISIMAAMVVVLATTVSCGNPAPKTTSSTKQDTIKKVDKVDSAEYAKDSVRLNK